MPRAVIAANVSGRSSAAGHKEAFEQWARGFRQVGFEAEVLDVGAGEEPLSASGDDLVLSVMGCLPACNGHTGMRVFLDIDPGYPQMWRELGLADMFAGHDTLATVGGNIGRAGCRIPTCGLGWVTTAPPVSLTDWPAVPGGRTFTTVAKWRNPYGTVTFDGRTYGSRVHEFRKFMELPRLVGAEFELALDIDGTEVSDLEALERNGWRLVDPVTVAGTPERYRDYIQGSGAEFCVAQNMYVATRSGWLSDRSVCYLASGKPVLAQDTGFSADYPVGEGLIAFSTLEEAAAGVAEISEHYEGHSHAARALAEEYFDAATVVGRLLTTLGRDHRRPGAAEA